MQSAYTIVHMSTGDVFGSNDKSIAESYVMNDKYLVINNMTGESYDASGHLQEIKTEGNMSEAHEKGFDPNAGAEDPDTGGGNDTGTGR